jgi:uncharacterized protein (DUF2062 family)
MRGFPSSRFAQAGQWRAAQEQAQSKLLAWLSSGLEPRQLAFTLALGFAIGCIPLLGVTTGICALLAMLFGLNMPAIQAANWLAMPFQMVLLIPFLKLGQWMFPGASFMTLDRSKLTAQVVAAPWHTVGQMGGLFGHALLAWLLAATPALLLMTLLLTPVLHLVSRRAAVIQAE